MSETKKLPTVREKVAECESLPMKFRAMSMSALALALARDLATVTAERDELAALTPEQRKWKHLADCLERCGKLEAERDAALAEVQEQARLNGMGSEREARLLAERDAAIARAERAEAALQSIRDSTYRNAVTLRGMADIALAAKEAPDA